MKKSPDARTAGRQYKAFVSYSHTDEDWAAWLQQSLERYRLPKRVRLAEPSAPSRLSPVFRDREELSSSGNLSESITDALQRSSTLLVICSPNAAQSHWVNEEIRTYRALHPQKKILCLIVEGSPDPTSVDCAFPRALLENELGQAIPEPLAADPRAEADGKRGALLKIVAGMLGIDVAILTQRDQQRRNRVIALSFAAALSVAITTSFLAVNAMLARQEAETRRVQAERLIDYMLVDLRAQLEPLGQLHILDSIGNEAMEYFALLGSQGNSSEVYARAMALRQIGEVRFSQGRLDPALASFVESLQLTAMLVESDPANDAWLFEKGQAEFWVGYAAIEQGNLDLGEASMRRYRTISIALSERDPANQKYIMEVAYSAQNLAGMELTRGRPAAALPHSEESASQWQALISLDQDKREYHQGLAEALSWRGSILNDLGELTLSIASYKESQEVFQYLRTSYDHTDDISGYCAVTLHLATGARLAGDLDYALDQFESVRKDAKSLSQQDTENALWNEHYARAMIGLGQTYRDLGDLENSLQWLKAGFDSHEQLVLQDPTSQRFQAHYILASALLAENAMLRDDAVGAKAQADRTQSALNSVNSNNTGDERLTIKYIKVLDILGEFETQFGEGNGIPPSWRKASELLESLEMKGLLLKAMYVRLMHKLDRGAEVSTLFAEVEQSGLKAPDFLP